MKMFYFYNGVKNPSAFCIGVFSEWKSLFHEFKWIQTISRIVHNMLFCTYCLCSYGQNVLNILDGPNINDAWMTKNTYSCWHWTYLKKSRFQKQKKNKQKKQKKKKKKKKT